LIRVRSILLPLVTLAALAAPAAAVPEQLGLTARVVDAGAPITGNHVVTVRRTPPPAAAPRCGPRNQNVAATDGLVSPHARRADAAHRRDHRRRPAVGRAAGRQHRAGPRLVVTSAAYAIPRRRGEDSELLGGQPVTASPRPATPTPASTCRSAPRSRARTESRASTHDRLGHLRARQRRRVGSAGRLTQAGTVFSVAFAGSGVGATPPAAITPTPARTCRSGPRCRPGQFETADLASGNVQCAAEVGDIARSPPAPGSPAGRPGDATWRSRSRHGAAAAARSDRATASLPGAATPQPTRTANGVSTVICLRALFGAADWNAASRSCLTDAAAQLCSYQQIIQVRGLAPAFGLQNAFWLADRMGDNTAYVTNTTGPSDDFDSVGTVTDTKTGYYCCLERRWW
jgi:hypothetical protein